MTTNYDAIIVGSGVGGSAIAALLAHNGWRVLVLEKNKVIGGRCTSYEKDGFTVDLGVHLFGVGANGALGDVCRSIGRPDAIDWVTIRTPTLKLKDQVMKYSRKNMTASLPEDEVKKLENFFATSLLMSDEELDKLWYTPLSEWIARFTSDPLAQTFIEGIQGQYFCVRSDQGSTTEFIRCFRDVLQARSSAYPVGGCISIPKAYLSAVEDSGSQVILRARVEKVLVEDNRAVGVRLKDGTEYRAPVIISNADIKASVLELVGEDHFPEEYVKRIKNLTYAVHVIGLKVALREKITDDQLVMYMPYDQAEGRQISQEIAEGKLPELLPGMITAPTNYDPSLAPEGRQMIFFGTSCPPKQDWKQWEKTLLRSFHRVYPQAEGKILWHRLDTPDVINGYAGEEGNVIGIGQTVDQIHERRPSVKSPLEGLYFASAEAGGHGIGAELAADSARELFRVLQGNKE